MQEGQLSQSSDTNGPRGLISPLTSDNTDTQILLLQFLTS